MSSGTLYDKVWDLHQVSQLPGGATQLFIGLHLIHEVTSPQAFAGLKDLGLTVRHPERCACLLPCNPQHRLEQSRNSTEGAGEQVQFVLNDQVWRRGRLAVFTDLEPKHPPNAKGGSRKFLEIIAEFQ